MNTKLPQKPSNINRSFGLLEYQGHPGKPDRKSKSVFNKSDIESYDYTWNPVPARRITNRLSGGLYSCVLPAIGLQTLWRSYLLHQNHFISCQVLIV